MKRLKQHWSARLLSALLSLAMILPVLLTGLAGARPAGAQGLTRSGQPKWLVLDFTNSSGYGGAEVGRLASDGLVVQLSDRYDILPRQQTQQGVTDLGQTLPLDPIGLQKLGHSLGEDAVVTGDVASVSFSNGGRQATVGIVIRVTDVTSGELINGAVAKGVSNPAAINTSDKDALVNQAIDNAVFDAAKQINGFSLPRATVLQNEDEHTVLLNKGTRDGLYNGLTMIVTRAGAYVGQVRVSNAFADQSDAVIIKSYQGTQPQDRATAIYQLPSYNVNNHGDFHNGVTQAGVGSQGQRSSYSTGLVGLLLAGLIGFALVSANHSGSSSGSLGGAQIGQPTATLVPGNPLQVHITASRGNLTTNTPGANGNITGYTITGPGITTKTITTSGDLDTFITAPATGNNVQFSVSAMYTQITGNNVVTTAQTPPRLTNPVSLTPAPVTLTQANITAGATTNTITVSVPPSSSQPAGDTTSVNYQLQVSSDPTFPSGTTTITSATPNSKTPNVTFSNVDISTLPTGVPLFARILTSFAANPTNTTSSAIVAVPTAAPALKHRAVPSVPLTVIPPVIHTPPVVVPPVVVPPPPHVHAPRGDAPADTGREPSTDGRRIKLWGK